MNMNMNDQYLKSEITALRQKLFLLHTERDLILNIINQANPRASEEDLVGKLMSLVSSKEKQL